MDKLDIEWGEYEFKHNEKDRTITIKFYFSINGNQHRLWEKFKATPENIAKHNSIENQKQRITKHIQIHGEPTNSLSNSV